MSEDRDQLLDVASGSILLPGPSPSDAGLTAQLGKAPSLDALTALKPFSLFPQGYQTASHCQNLGADQFKS